LKNDERDASRFPDFHSTKEIIRSIEAGAFPLQAMMTIHPQR
jgi:hypothetical protein